MCLLPPPGSRTSSLAHLPHVMRGVTPVDGAPLADAEPGEVRMVQQGRVLAEAGGSSRQGRVDREERLARGIEDALRDRAAGRGGLGRTGLRKVPPGRSRPIAPARPDVTVHFVGRGSPVAGRRPAGASEAAAPPGGGQPPPPLPPTGINHVWACEFLFDTCPDGRSLKCLTDRRVHAGEPRDRCRRRDTVGATVRAAVDASIKALPGRRHLPGVAVAERRGAIHIAIPDQLRNGHEAHIAQSLATSCATSPPARACRHGDARTCSPSTSSRRRGPSSVGSRRRVPPRASHSEAATQYGSPAGRHPGDGLARRTTAPANPTRGRGAYVWRAPFQGGWRCDPVDLS